MSDDERVAELERRIDVLELVVVRLAHLAARGLGRPELTAVLRQLGDAMESGDPDRMRAAADALDKVAPNS